VQGTWAITGERFCEACRYIRVDEQTFSNKELLAFLSSLAPMDAMNNAMGSTFAMGTMGSTMNPHTRSAQDSMQLTMPGQPARYNIETAVEGYRRYLGKSPEQVLQDILNEIFVTSKQLGFSQSVLTLFTDVDDARRGWVTDQ